LMRVIATLSSIKVKSHSRNQANRGASQEAPFFVPAIDTSEARRPARRQDQRAILSVARVVETRSSEVRV